MSSRVLLLLLVAALACAMVNVKPGPAEDAVVAGCCSATAGLVADVRRVGRPSSYWKLERRYVAALKREGRLGAEVRRLRRHEQARTLQAVGTSGLERAFLCIHGGEAAWDGTDNATHHTYFGGLQMDREFQQSYGPEFLRAWGTADHWPQSVQITVAIRAYLSGRGFNPWPNTARACGLLP